MTPEGKVKQAVSKLIAQYTGVYSFMPVPSGYGKSTLDYILCVRGNFVSIEAKRPDEAPTPRQWDIIAQMESAGAHVFVIDDVDCQALADLEEFLEQYAQRKPTNPSKSKPEAPRRGSAPRARG